MQTPKPRNESSEVSQRTSPGTPRSARVTKTRPSESDSTASRPTPAKTPIDRSPKGMDRRSPRSPVTEKKRPSRVTELESQLLQTQDDLKKAKEQLGASESWKRKAQQEAEETMKQFSTMSAKLEDSQRQLVEFSAAEEARLQELRKISQERDRAWQSELEATQNQHSVDSAALSTAMNEIHRLRQQIEMVNKSEAAQAKQSEMARSELQVLKRDMAETVSIVENLKGQLRNSEKAEAEARAIVHDTQKQLEMAKTTVDSLHADGSKLMESFSATASKLEESRARVNSLEGTVKKLQANHRILDREGVLDKHLESEVEQLRSALEAVEIKYQEEQIQSTIQLQSAYESVERAEVESGLRTAKLESSLRNAKAEIFELKSGLIDKETELQSFSDMNKLLSTELEKTKVDQMDSGLESRLVKSIVEVAELRANLMDKETELQCIAEENELLKLEMGKREMESHKSYEAAITDVELARAAERDALMRLGCAAEEADKSRRRAARVAEQLEAAQAVGSEMEAELRRLRVQTDQWRKAAEAAAAALTPGSNGKFVERTSSFDPDYHSVGGKLMSSPFSDDLEEGSPKKKNNVLRKIGGLWKKSPK